MDGGGVGGTLHGGGEITCNTCITSFSSRLVSYRWHQINITTETNKHGIGGVDNKSDKQKWTKKQNKELKRTSSVWNSLTAEKRKLIPSNQNILEMLFRKDYAFH